MTDNEYSGSRLSNIQNTMSVNLYFTQLGTAIAAKPQRALELIGL